MKLLAIRLARSIWLFPQYFLNPKGAYIYPAVEALKSRYSFLKSPADFPTAAPNEPVKFENGAFSGKNGTVLIASVTLHNDGIVVDTRSSTDDCDEFLEDALNWMSSEYGLAAYADIPMKKMYISELNVIFDKQPKIVNPKLVPFIKELSSLIGSEQIGDAHFMSLCLSTDQTLSANAPQFRFEREINTPFGENRYYSFSPTTTDVHLDLLAKLEELV